MSTSQLCAPTCTGIGIRNATEAFTILEAVRTGILPPVRRHRLSQAERDELGPGQVFVWTESADSSGLERWTDGRKWSASRTRDVFLIYEEREEPSVEEHVEKASQRINSYFSNTTSGSGDLFGIFAFPKDRPPKLDGLMKQTFSAWVSEPGTGQKVKWHLSAYLSRQGPGNLLSVADHPTLSRVRVPNGVYECCTGPRKNRRGSRAQQPGPAALQVAETYRRAANRQSSREASPTGSSGSLRVLVKAESEYWDDGASASTISLSPSSAYDTPPRTISASSIGSTADTERRRLPRILGPRSGSVSYYGPPSPTDSMTSSSISGASPVNAYDPYRSPSLPTQEPNPYRPSSHIPSLPYALRSEADSKAVAAFPFRPF